VQFLLGPRYREPFFVSAADLIRSGAGRSPALGYLKPVIRADLLGELRYDEAVRIGEDQDLLLRILLRDANFWVVPTPWYLYRRHRGSISHRLSSDEVTRMIDSQRRLLALEGKRHPEIVRPLRRRLRRPSLGAPLLLAAGEHFGKRNAGAAAPSRPWPAGPVLPAVGKAALAGRVAE
jgi:succinoglycan biosynthesis protein ExoO